jgi:hypothetical protein
MNAEAIEAIRRVKPNFEPDLDSVEEAQIINFPSREMDELPNLEVEFTAAKRGLSLIIGQGQGSKRPDGPAPVVA